MYATSYGPNGTTIDAESPIECSYVKQIRNLITTVSSYTGQQQVNVVGHSLGAAVARKVNWIFIASKSHSTFRPLWEETVLTPERT